MTEVVPRRFEGPDEVRGAQRWERRRWWATVVLVDIEAQGSVAFA